MPANLRWYPNELPALAQSSSSTSALEASVRSLQNDARIAAIRQALGRRSSGVIAAAQQNTGSIVIGSLMPLVIDPVTRSQPATQTVSSVGTVGYVVGSSVEGTARNTDRVTFATDVVATLGDRVNLGRRSRGGASSLTRGLLAGGEPPAAWDDGKAEIEDFVYATETSTTLGVKLPFTEGTQGTSRTPGGFSSRTHGYFVASYWGLTDIAKISFESRAISSLQQRLSGDVYFVAAAATPSTAVMFGDRRLLASDSFLSFATDTVSSQPGSSLTSGESRQVLGNGGDNLYVFGGRNANPTWNYRFSVSTRTFSRVTGDLPAATVNAARVGNSTQGYLCGGSVGPYHYWNSWQAAAGFTPVYKFVYATETLSTNVNPLTVLRSHPVGISNYAGAFFGQ